MSKQSKKKAGNETLRTLLTVLLAVVILAVIVAAVLLLSSGGKDNPEPTETAELPAEEITEPSEERPLIEIPYEIPGFTLLQEVEVGQMEGGLELLGVGRYTGAYFEDGSDEEIADVYAAVVKNNGEDWVDFAAITLGCTGRTLSFEISSLPGGTAVLVLEANRLCWAEGDVCTNPHAVCTEDTAEHIYDFSDSFELYPSDGVINLKNISETSFENDVLVYYKNYDYGLFLGGVTYRARFAGVAAGEIGQSIQSHYSDARSMILYLNYDD